jgi:hypothetical protein
MVWAAILAAAAVATQAPPATTAPTASAAAQPGELTPAQELKALQDIYAQSCGDRAYGSFEDACFDMRKQIREVEKQMRKQAQEAQRKR